MPPIKARPAQPRIFRPGGYNGKRPLEAWGRDQTAAPFCLVRLGLSASCTNHLAFDDSETILLRWNGSVRKAPCFGSAPKADHRNDISWTSVAGAWLASAARS